MLDAYSLIVALLAALCAAGSATAVGWIAITGVSSLLRIDPRALPRTLVAGAGFAIGAVFIGKALPMAGSLLPLSTAGWSIVGLSAVLATVLWLAKPPSRNKTHDTAQTLKSETGAPSEVISDALGGSKRGFRLLFFCLMALIAAHCALALTNNLIRPIFPWDAFTTWMYRAKAWASTNTIFDFANAADWLRSGGTEGYALYANHYPTTLSGFAAFTSALTGGWSDAAASLPWSSALVALALVMYGSFRLARLNPLTSLMGAYLLISMPLMGLHSALAGYGDLWMALTSGMGLASLLLWRGMRVTPTDFDQPGAESSIQPLMGMGFALLLAGTQIKLEGWLWLGMGVIYYLSAWSLDHFGRFRVAVAVSIPVGVAVLMVLLTDSASLDLGPLGVWGIGSTMIHVGPLGSYGLQPYDPTARYFEALFTSPNFHLVGTFYLSALIVLGITRRSQAIPFWSIGLLVALSQLIIFGFSSFSEYAETGTAINRLLLHFMPVAVVTVMAGYESLTAVAQRTQNNHRSTRSFLVLTGVVPPTMAAILAAWLLLPAPPERGAPFEAELHARQMNPVAGSLVSATTNEDEISGELLPLHPSKKASEQNAHQQFLKFLSSPAPVGVLQADIDGPVTLPRWLLGSNRGGTNFDVRFYWISTDAPAQVNNTPLPGPGEFLIDLQQAPKWTVAPVTEFGLLVPEAAFQDTQLGFISLKSELTLSDYPAIAKHWFAPIHATQVSLNAQREPRPVGVGYSAWTALTATLLIGVLVILILGPQAGKFPALAVSGGVLPAALLILWLGLDAFWLRQFSELTAASYRDILQNSSFQGHEGYHLVGPADAISKQLDTATPIAVVPADGSNVFEAQKLPLLLLPKRSMFTRPSGGRLNENWSGDIIIVANDSKIASNMLPKLERQTQRHLTIVGAAPPLWLIR